MRGNMETITLTILLIIDAMMFFFIGYYTGKKNKKVEITRQTTASLIILSAWFLMEIVSFVYPDFQVSNVFNAMALGAGANIIGLDLSKFNPLKK